LSNCDGNNNNGCEFNCPLQTNTLVLQTVPNYPTTQTCALAVPELSQREIPRFGTGNTNGYFTTASLFGVTIGLRLEERQVGPIVPDEGGKVYDTEACYSFGTQQSNFPNNVKASWNYAFHIDLRNGTGAFFGTTFNDFNMQFSFQNLFNDNSQSNPGFPTPFDASLFAANLIETSLCTCNKTTNPIPQPFFFTDTPSAKIPWTTCTDLATKITPGLKFLQESTNIRFQNPNFNYKQAGAYLITLTLVPKNFLNGCNCPLSVSIVAGVHSLPYAVTTGSSPTVNTTNAAITSCPLH